MEAIREIYEDAPEELRLTLPPALRHRRVEIIVLPLDDPKLQAPHRTGRRYQTLRVQKRVIVPREALHER